MTEITGLTSTDAMSLLRHTLEQLEVHLDDPDGSSLSGQGMLEVTRDRLSTLYALVVNLIQPSGDSRLTPACPRCTTCSEPIVWSESRGNWTHRNYVAVPHAVTPPAPAAEQATPRGRLQEVAEELAELPEICRDLVGPRCGEAVDRARDARRIVREILEQPALAAAPEATPAPWVDTRDDDGRWLTGSDPCPAGCPHVLMAHRSDVGCISCDCQHGITAD